MSGITPAAGAADTGAGTITPSWIRTVTPVIVGAVLTYLFGVETGWLRGLADALGLTEEAISTGLTLAVTAVLTAIYHYAVRYAETHYGAQFGWLLGLAKQPLAYAPQRARGRDGGYGAVELVVVVLVIIILIVLLTRLL